MRVVLQRVRKSSVTVNNEVIGQINHGLMVLVGVKCGDTTKDADELVGKIVKLRIFDDENGVMNKSIVDSGGDILTVSNFTLYADCKKGCRPSYSTSAPFKEAKVLYDYFNSTLEGKLKKKIETGIFGANMQVDIANDGPITIIIDSMK